MQRVAERETAIEEKLDELIALLAQTDLNSETIKEYQQRFNLAITAKDVNLKAIAAFKVIDEKSNASREELLDEFSTLLLLNRVDSNLANRYLRGETINKIILILTGIAMIALGFAMIVMPAPPYFEMFTIYYFSRDDGITLMDLISLIIILSGVYVLVRSIYKRKTIAN